MAVCSPFPRLLPSDGHSSSEAWHVVTTVDAFLDSDEEDIDEPAQHAYGMSSSFHVRRSYVPDFSPSQPCVSRCSLIFTRASPPICPVNGNERVPPNILVSSHVQHHYPHPPLLISTHIFSRQVPVCIHSITRSHKLFPVYMLTTETGLPYITLRPTMTCLIPRIQILYYHSYIFILRILEFYLMMSLHCNLSYWP